MGEQEGKRRGRTRGAASWERGRKSRIGIKILVGVGEPRDFRVVQKPIAAILFVRLLLSRKRGGRERVMERGIQRWRGEPS